MKKVLLLAGAALLLMCTACTKEKNCRCAVQGTQNVRIVTIKKGNCNKINVINYFDALDTMHTDVVVCTDYPFDSDSLIIIR
ncbi:MAG: hypothetical protein MJZ67_06885 [Bacteroidales bacterium]|nr:hypothetical protein [Bacteroidales bacterium]